MKKVYTIGRDLQSDIVIEDDSDIISRLHATIRFDGSKMYIIDQSQNGTYVNGMRMSANEEVPVSRKDTVSFANVAELDWSRLPDPSKARMKIMWIIIFSILALLLIVCAILYFTRRQEPVTTDKIQTEVTTDLDTNNDGTDNVVEEDSVAFVPKPVEETNEVSNKKGGKSNKTKEGKDDITDKPDKEKEEPKTEGDIPLY